jgi:UDP-glucuronate decarboxylase
MNNILITGGAGFIGSNLCERLLEEGNTIYCVDNFETSSENNIKNFFSKEKFHLLNMDISVQQLNEIFLTTKINQIYNLASPAAPQQFRNNPIKTLETNIQGTINILNFSKNFNIPILHASTIRVFESEHIGKNACYIEGKRCAETLLTEYRKKYNIDIKIARLFNVYGKNMSLNDSRVIPQFIMKSLKDDDLEIFGNGTQIDSFCYIDDIIDVLIKFMNARTETILNIGNPITISIVDLAKLIINVLSSKSKIKFINPSFVDNKPMNLDISKTIELLHWKPKISLEKGIELTANYYKKII